jgi:hypothetical protein
MCYNLKQQKKPAIDENSKLASGRTQDVLTADLLLHSEVNRH